ncbi:putative glycosyltransferase EpsJ [Paracoccus haematequi]|uniref:Putative glycosyltransferase EpsJ n=1 Tax=Paracoccus haematequi TaxID=2491866 RepID=A0A3S4CMC5_9RHOB|nr:glycosyltransferase [Paracoccus haematequi]VDS10770.1 putative glycosyltransferase EpsJ [Paracoccus haematequi]
MPKLSVIVTAYNIESYIAQCLDSVIGQTMTDIEIIVVDDGSTDSTAQIIHDYAGRDDRIRPILFERNTIGGVASAANAGLDAATGDYVGFADGDDICDTDMFRRLYQAAVAADADLAMCQYRLLDEQTGVLAEPADSHRWAGIGATAIRDLEGDPEGANRKWLLEFVAVPWRKIYRRAMLEREAIRFPVGDYFYEDNPFHWFAVLSANRVALVPQALCHHRVARVGQTMATVDDRLLKIFDHEATIRAWLKSHGRDDVYAPALLTWVLAQLSWVSLRAEGEMQRRLFDKLAPIVQGYSDGVVDGVAQGHVRGNRAVTMLHALRRKDFATFSRAAGYRLAEKSLIGLGLHHLRHTGLRHTAGITARFLRSRVSRGRAAMAAYSLPVPKGRLATKLSDIQFSLAILQRRLDSLEQELRQLRQDRPKDDDRA